MNSIFKNKKYWQNMSEDELFTYSMDIFFHYKRKGFPYFELNVQEQQNIFEKLIKFDIKSINKIEDNLSQNMLGLNLCNYFMKHMWETKCNSFNTPMNAFLDSDMFLKAINKRLKMGDNISDAGIRKTLSLVSGTHRVSNFRPTIAKYLYETYGGENNLDFSSGFGGRLVGFLASNNKTYKYVGVEPNILTYSKLMDISNQFKNNKEVELYNDAFEDLEFKNNSFDFIFSSPPYFNTEEYAYDEKQSFIRYTTKNSWRDNFLKTLIENNFNYLKDEGTFAINVANVKTYPELESDTLEIANKIGFKLVKTYKMTLSNLMGKGFKYEPIFVFKKT